MIGAVVLSLALGVSPGVGVQVSHDVEAAVAYWGRPAPCAPLHVNVVTALDDGAGGEVPGAMGPDGSWLPDLERCEMEVVPQPDPQGTCGVVVHEVGHLLGHGHSTVYGDVMESSAPPPAVCGNHWDYVRRCRGHGRQARCFPVLVWLPIRQRYRALGSTRR